MGIMALCFYILCKSLWRSKVIVTCLTIRHAESSFFLYSLTFNNNKNATQIQQFLVTFNSFLCFEWLNW